MSSSVQPGGAAVPPAQHEFDSQQNQTIASLAQDMRWVAAPLQFIGIMYGIACIMGIVRAFTHPESIVGAVFIGLATAFYLALGIWTQRAALSFQQITKTSGQDVTHLMEALENLRKKYSLLSLLVKIYIGLLLAVLVVTVIAMIAGAFQH